MPPSSSFPVFCPHCNIQAEARVIAAGDGGLRSEAAEKAEEMFAMYHGDRYYVALCRRCGSPFLIRQALYEREAEFETITTEEVLFPLSSRVPLDGVPSSVQRSFDQACRAFTSSSFDACALMCRRSLEALCNELGFGGATLQAKLETLRAAGVIDARLAGWAHGVRAIGNEAAHDTASELSKDDARDAVDFTEAILTYIYVLGRRFDAFRARRKANP
jgi:hypothetical protein